MVDRSRACLLGGAIGDALGAPVEFLQSRGEIEGQFGPDGITDFVEAYGRIGAITDDTQMTLFTAEGLLRGVVRGNLRGIGGVTPHIIAYAYLRWLDTQTSSGPCAEDSGWLIQHPELFSRRAPGDTCLKALVEVRRTKPNFALPAENNSKGCGGVMRVAPAGILMATAHDLEGSLQKAFELGSDAAAITHGHHTGYLAAGTFAAIVAGLMHGIHLYSAVELAKEILVHHEGSTETVEAIDRAVVLARSGIAHHDSLVTLGEGWIAEEALAMSLYVALTATDFRSALILAVNHGGDSDSTGAITGNLLGAQLGSDAIPDVWIGRIELREAIEQLAKDLVECHGWEFGYHTLSDRMQAIVDRYPGV